MAQCKECGTADSVTSSGLCRLCKIEATIDRVANQLRKVGDALEFQQKQTLARNRQCGCQSSSGHATNDQSCTSLVYKTLQLGGTMAALDKATQEQLSTPQRDGHS